MGIFVALVAENDGEAGLILERGIGVRNVDLKAVVAAAAGALIIGIESNLREPPADAGVHLVIFVGANWEVFVYGHS